MCEHAVVKLAVECDVFLCLLKFQSCQIVWRLSLFKNVWHLSKLILVRFDVSQLWHLSSYYLLFFYWSTQFEACQDWHLPSTISVNFDICQVWHLPSLTSVTFDICQVSHLSSLISIIFGICQVTTSIKFHICQVWHLPSFTSIKFGIWFEVLFLSFSDICQVRLSHMSSLISVKFNACSCLMSLTSARFERPNC